MKNQYFGDVCDYQKYGLLRGLIQHTRLRLAVCWMLTPGDGRTDGGKIAYLKRPDLWRHYDPNLFDILRDSVQAGLRDIAVVEERGILPDAVGHADLLVDGHDDRRRYFSKLEARAAQSDMVFFDPDNGLEVASTPVGRKGSSKYLYWDEARQCHAQGKSLIVFQHFCRVDRSLFMAILRRRLMDETGADWVGVLRTSNLVYFVVPAPAHAAKLQGACECVSNHWGQHIRHHY
jgi:hypothetical protein